MEGSAQSGTNRAFRVWRAYRLRWKRRYLLGRAIRRRRAVQPRLDRTGQITPDAILCFAVVRNEALRLPWFLAHHRALGVGHFLFVDNASTDDTAALLAAEPDVSVFRAEGSYKAARFGLDWLNWLLFRYGRGHWCLTLDADEALFLPEGRGLADLTGWLDRHRADAFRANMIDLVPDGPLGAQDYRPGQDPRAVLTHFDPGGFWAQPQAELKTEILRGGIRARRFFAAEPKRAPTMNKVPLVRWSPRYCYLNSTHSALPPRLNLPCTADGARSPIGALLHSKFLPDAPARAAEERQRREHFANSDHYEDYYRALAQGPDLSGPEVVRFEGWAQLAMLGLADGGDWQSKA